MYGYNFTFDYDGGLVEQEEYGYLVVLFFFC